MEAEQSEAAAASWAAAAAARDWLSSIRSHTACVACSAAWSAVAEADEAVLRATDNGRRVVDAQGMFNSGALEVTAAEFRQAAVATKRAAKLFRRSSRLDGAAASTMMRARRASRRAADEEHAKFMLRRAKQARKEARDEARQAAIADERTATLLHYAGRVAACADAMAAMDRSIGTGGGIGASAFREMSLKQADIWEDAKKCRLDSEATAKRAAEAVRLNARMRRMIASAANQAADIASAAEAEAEAEGRDGMRRDDPDAKKAAAAWRRAMAAANRADAAARRGSGGDSGGDDDDNGEYGGGGDDGGR